jgi:tetratricopeptide (TPR) repeat protein
MESNVAQLPLTDRIWAWFETNKKPAAVGSGVVLVAGLIIWFVVWQQEQKQIDAGYALSDVAVGSGPSRTDTPEAYLRVAATFPKSPAGAQALLLAAGNLFGDGKFAEAQSQFERFVREYRESPFVGQALLGVAASLDAQGKTEQALTAYKDLVTRYPKESVIPQAKFALARLYEAQGKPELARDLFEQVEHESPYGSIGQEAGMRVEDLNEKYPKPAPAPASMAPLSTTPLSAAPLISASPTNAPLKVQAK